MNEFLVMKAQVRNRQALIANLQSDLDYLNENIERTTEVLAALESDLDRLKSEYTATLRTALRHKLQQSFAAFLFSARDFNDAFQRWRYVRQYQKFRRRQSQSIIDTQQTLDEKAAQLEIRKLDQQDLLDAVEDQQISVEKELGTLNHLLSNLQNDEKQLAQQLAEQEEERARLNTAIASIIRRETLAARENNAETSPGGSNNARSTGNFSTLQGQLPWPVPAGTIVRPYGVHQHPKYPEVKVTNNGIDIQTEARALVQAVLDGKVAGTQFIPGYKNTVILQHGNFYSVYSNLDELYVRRGDQLKAGDHIGKLHGAKPEMHFEIWQEKKRLDPTSWLVRR